MYNLPMLSANSFQKEEANENGMTEVELENFEPLPEYVECYKLENGKIFNFLCAN